MPLTLKLHMEMVVFFCYHLLLAKSRNHTILDSDHVQCDCPSIDRSIHFDAKAGRYHLVSWKWANRNLEVCLRCWWRYIQVYPHNRNRSFEDRPLARRDFGTVIVALHHLRNGSFYMIYFYPWRNDENPCHSRMMIMVLGFVLSFSFPRLRMKLFFPLQKLHELQSRSL